MGSRSSGSAIVFLVLLLGVGFYAAYQAKEPASAPEPDTTAAGDAASPAKTASTEAASTVDAGSTADAPATQGSADAAGAGDDAPAPSADDTASGSETAQAGSESSGEASPAEPQTDVASGAGDGTTGTPASEATRTDEQTTTTMELETPSYDVVRVEPTGDAVIAGRASPGATIVLEANGKVIGQTTANAGGEWVIVLDEPLKPGDYDIAVRASREATQEEKASVERLAVSIPHNGTETPLVAVTRPDAPDTVLQKPEPSAGGTQVAAAAETQTGAADGTQAASPAPAGSADAQTASAAPPPEQAAEADAAAGTGTEETVIGTLRVREETISEPVASGTAEAAGTKPAAVPGETSTAASTDTGGQSIAASTTGSDSPTAGASSADAASAPASTGAASGAGASSDVAATSSAPATDTAGAPSGQPAAASLPITIESAEADAGTFRVSGISEPGTDVWLYFDGEFMGEAKAGADGRWQFEASMALEAGESSIRADQIDDPKGSVAARAEVPFGYRAARQQTVAAADSQDDASTDAPAKAATATSEAPEVEVVGETDEGVRVLIRRGDDLWTIARHFYGDGFSYTSIYRANGGQIRNPHLIYPGQVFTLPGLTKKDVTGEAQKRAL